MKETHTPALDVLGQRNLELGPFLDGGQSACSLDPLEIACR